MSSLFTPLTVGTKTLRNRIAMSALTRNRAPGTIPTDLMAEYYVQRATGGAGLIVTEGILVSRQGFVNPPCTRYYPNLFFQNGMANCPRYLE